MTTTTEDLLIEARDPKTPGERLMELFYSKDKEAQDPYLARLLCVNPNIPAGMFDALVRSGNRAVWFNPSLPLFLLMQPHPDYARLAQSAVVRAGTAESFYEPERVTTLAQVIALWAAIPARTSGPSRAHQLAHVIAGLFNLPWTTHPWPLPPGEYDAL